MDSPISSEASTPLEIESPHSVGTPETQPSDIFDNIGDFCSRLPSENQYILVTGGLGFIGSHTTLQLLKSSHNVIIIDNLSNSFENVFDRISTLANKFHRKNGTQMPTLRLYVHDYRDITALKALLVQYQAPQRWGVTKSNITGVIHFAAHKAVEESTRQPLRYYANNVSGMVDFVSTLGDFGIKNFIFSSSATIYGTLANSGLPLKEELCVHKSGVYTDEEGTIRTIQPGCTGITNPYGRTKWMCETILADLAASDPEWTIVALRYFNPVGCDSSGILGEGSRHTPTNLLPVVVRVMTGQYAELRIYGTDWDTEDGTAVRDFIHVTDLAQGHIAALNAAIEGKLDENFRTFNLGTGCGHSVLDVVNAMEQASSRPIPPITAERRVGDVGSCVAAVDRSRQELQWRTEKTLEDACADICKFLELSYLA